MKDTDLDQARLDTMTARMAELPPSPERAWSGSTEHKLEGDVLTRFPDKISIDPEDFKEREREFNRLQTDGLMEEGA